MASPLETIIAAGSKLWLDSVDPELVASNRQLGATGATSNPIIIGDLIKSGRFDDRLATILGTENITDSDAAWQLTDEIVSAAQTVFSPVWEATSGNDGYVSFELDPLLEGADSSLTDDQRIQHYVELGKRWSAGQNNRMIKVPATPGGLAALEDLAASGASLNVTLIFTMRQYRQARDAIWRGAQRRPSLEGFKSVYSIFISRVDVYSQKHVPELSAAAQGQVGLVNVKEIWRENQKFWSDCSTPLEQEIVFASTGAKLPGDEPWKYVEALVGSGIQTNPPATNDAVNASGKSFRATVGNMPPEAVVEEIAEKVDVGQMEATLMEEGVEKFAAPQRALLSLVAKRREQLRGTS